MEQIGSINESLVRKAIVRYVIDGKASQASDGTNEAIAREEGYLKTLDVHQEIGASTVGTILYIEQYLLIKELEKARGPSEVSSLKNAIDEIEAARGNLSLTGDTAGYKKMVADLAPQDKKESLPLDTVRRCLKSHKGRLRDRIKHPSGLSDGQYAILKQRLKSLQYAEDSYKKAQREVLGDDWKPEKDYTQMPPLPSDSTSRESEDKHQEMTTEEMKKQIADYEAQKIAYAKKRIEGLSQSLQYGYALKAKEDFDKQHAEEAASIAEMKKIVAEREPKQPKVQKHRKRDDLER